MNTEQNHNCECLQPLTGCGQAITRCLERHGEFWVENDEYMSQVNYCPYCGAKAPIERAAIKYGVKPTIHPMIGYYGD